MGATGPIHHIGTFLLFAGFVLLLVVSISAPVINDIALMKISLANTKTNLFDGSSVNFGTFGYCLMGSKG
jgi:hypothetical protein